MDNLSWKSHKIDHLLYQRMGHEKAFLCSTDTVLGLIAPVTQEGKDALDTIKKRRDRPYLVIIGALDQMDYFIDKDVKSDLLPLFKAIWPGPVTLILPAKKDLPPYCISPENTVALRIPSHAGLQKTALHFKGIFSTSANISGMPIPNSMQDVDRLILTQIATTVIDSDMPTICPIPSTIIDCSKKPYSIVREGAYNKTTLTTLLSHY
ncbi:MAG TPA: L-threonylcarbamoyladenylate synthase [Patescibacteria group bacterium]|jgi:L-threonylcarbamoyladenylate synthase|nr:L-threonylcarbamoyladenylate synthase [Patescibacteria group bacterium]